MASGGVVAGGYPRVRPISGRLAGAVLAYASSFRSEIGPPVPADGRVSGWVGARTCGVHGTSIERLCGALAHAWYSFEIPLVAHPQIIRGACRVSRE